MVPPVTGRPLRETIADFEAARRYDDPAGGHDGGVADAAGRRAHVRDLTAAHGGAGDVASQSWGASAAARGAGLPGCGSRGAR
jgi:hypothetical protein